MKLFLFLVAVCFVLGIIAGGDVGAFIVGLCVLSIPLCVVVGIFLKLKRYMKARQPEFERELAARREALRKAERIVEVNILDGGSLKHTRYGLTGVVVGGVFFGPLGALVGYFIPKDTKQKQRFLVKYEDGHTEIKEAFPGTDECKNYLKYIK